MEMYTLITYVHTSREISLFWDSYYCGIVFSVVSSAFSLNLQTITNMEGVKHSTIATNGINMHIAEIGSGLSPPQPLWIHTHTHSPKQKLKDKRLRFPYAPWPLSSFMLLEWFLKMAHNSEAHERSFKIKRNNKRYSFPNVLWSLSYMHKALDARHTKPWRGTQLLILGNVEYFVWWLHQSMPIFHNNDIFVNERCNTPQIISHQEIWHAFLNRD